MNTTSAATRSRTLRLLDKRLAVNRIAGNAGRIEMTNLGTRIKEIAKSVVQFLMDTGFPWYS